MIRFGDPKGSSLAEDNVTNQIVAQGMLELYGCQVDWVANGRKAVEAVQKNHYDLIFMDCQMPELDGYEATNEIRRFEQQAGKAHTSIIALTAHAMSGDREKCLAAGMDDYLSKPLSQKQLHPMLEKWLSGSVPVAISMMKGVAVSEEQKNGDHRFDSSVFDMYRQIQLPGKPDIVRKIIDSYLRGASALLQVIADGVRNQDSKALWQAAHTMKSNNATVGALRMTEICSELEINGRAGSLENSEQLLKELEMEFPFIAAQLQELAGG